MTITGDLERFEYVNFETNFLKNENLFQKTEVSFLVEFTKTENTILPYKTALSKPKLRQTKYGVQNERMTKKHFHIFENLISV